LRLFAFLVLGHARWRLLWFAITRNPAAGVVDETRTHLALRRRGT
jgi:hypothetical protein